MHSISRVVHSNCIIYSSFFLVHFNFTWAPEKTKGLLGVSLVPRGGDEFLSSGGFGVRLSADVDGGGDSQPGRQSVAPRSRGSCGRWEHAAL